VSSASNTTNHSISSLVDLAYIQSRHLGVILTSSGNTAIDQVKVRMDEKIVYFVVVNKISLIIALHS